MRASAGIAVLGLGALLMPGGVASAAAAQVHCMTRILRDVGAMEAPEQVKSKSNGEFGPITQIRVYKDTGRMVYCAKNSYCYDSNSFEWTSACRIKRDLEGTTNAFFSFTTR